MVTNAAQRNQVLTPAVGEIRITRFFAAPRALVFKAWTDPLMLVNWFGCAAFTTTKADADLRVGGQWRVLMLSPEGEEFPAYGTYLEVREPERLRFTHQWEKPVDGVNPAGHPTEVSVVLHEEEGGTRLEFRQTGLASAASRDSHIGGWCDSLDALGLLM
jgi:uncharacterized protein YndB with AHSA1/START domain